MNPVSSIWSNGPKWQHRLFRQHDPANGPAPTGAELGYGGRAAELVVDDDYRADAIRAAQRNGDREQVLAATVAYLMKVRKHALAAADERGDPELVDLVDRFVDEVLVFTCHIKQVMRERGYAGPSPDDQPPHPGQLAA